jgi:hypothetical protein
MPSPGSPLYQHLEMHTRFFSEVSDLLLNVDGFRVRFFISRGPGINLRLSGGKVFSTCSFKDGCFSGKLPCDKRRSVSWRKNDIREDLRLLQS